MTQGRFKILPGYPADVLAIEAEGEIDREAYTRDLIPAVEEKISAEGKLRLLYVFGPKFTGFTAGAAWEDTRIGLLRLTDFTRIAVVADVEWVRISIRVFGPLIPCPVRVFALDEMEKARAWITERGEGTNGNSDGNGGIPGADADYIIPPLEDRIPPEP